MNAPATLDRPMRHVRSQALVDFAEIYEDDVEVVSVTTTISENIHRAVTTLLCERDLQAQWIHGGKDPAAMPGAGRRESVREALQVLKDEMDLPVSLLQELLDCTSCGVRIKVLEGPMCPRFHVDKVPCRMLMTYAGPGTEWIAHQDVDWDGFSAGDPDPTVPGGQIQQLPSGAWSLLKGGNWDGAFGGIVHRSPAEVDRRLLVSLDPIFSD